MFRLVNEPNERKQDMFVFIRLTSTKQTSEHE